MKQPVAQENNPLAGSPDSAAATRWISIQDNPSEMAYYLVWVRDGGAGWANQACIEFYNSTEQQWSGESGIIEDGGEVTHWAKILPPNVRTERSERKEQQNKQIKTAELVVSKMAEAGFAPSNCSPALVYLAEGRTENIRHHALETPNAAEALEHALKCWLVFGCREVTLSREWRKPSNDQAQPRPVSAVVERNQNNQ